MNEPSIPRDQPLRGIVLMLAALAFFSCSDAASKLMTATLPAVEVAWLRFCVFTLLILGAARMTGQERPLQSHRPVLHKSGGSYCADAPDANRAVMAQYAAALHHHDFDFDGPLLPPRARVVDAGNLPRAEDASENRARIRGAITAILNAGAVPLVIGGDDSVPIPLFEAFAGRGSYTVLQIDAHIDWRDDVNGERLGLSSTMRRASEMGQIGRIIQVGQRGIGSARPADVADAKAAGVHFISAHQVHREGLEPVLRLIEPGSELLITFDCDALDPAIMPGVIGRVPGGLSYWQAIDLLRGAAARAQIASFDLVEFMPVRDLDGTGALVAGRLLATAAGIVTRQAKATRPPLDNDS